MNTTRSVKRSVTVREAALWAKWIAFAGVLILGLAACSVVNPTIVTHYTPTPGALQDQVDCLTPSEWRPDYGPLDPRAKLMGSLPKGFVPVDVVRCTWPEGNNAAGREEHFTGDYGPLLSALAIPSDNSASKSCLDFAEGPLQLWLVNAQGKAVHVMWPLDVCGKSKPETANALARLHLTNSTIIAERDASK